MPIPAVNSSVPVSSGVSIYELQADSVPDTVSQQQVSSVQPSTDMAASDPSSSSTSPTSTSHHHHSTSEVKNHPCCLSITVPN
ncbi:hypothetical protein ACFXTH_031535 [Malus domestica]